MATIEVNGTQKLHKKWGKIQGKSESIIDSISNIVTQLEDSDAEIEGYRAEISQEVAKLQERLDALRAQDQAAAEQQVKVRRIKRNIEVNILGEPEKVDTTGKSL